jgi:hypothetical protein
MSRSQSWDHYLRRAKKNPFAEFSSFLHSKHKFWDAGDDSDEEFTHSIQDKENDSGDDSDVRSIDGSVATTMIDPSYAAWKEKARLARDNEVDDEQDLTNTEPLDDGHVEDEEEKEAKVPDGAAFGTSSTLISPAESKEFVDQNKPYDAKAEFNSALPNPSATLSALGLTPPPPVSIETLMSNLSMNPKLDKALDIKADGFWTTFKGGLSSVAGGVKKVAGGVKSGAATLGRIAASASDGVAEILGDPDDSTPAAAPPSPPKAPAEKTAVEQYKKIAEKLDAKNKKKEIEKIGEQLLASQKKAKAVARESVRQKEKQETEKESAKAAARESVRQKEKKEKEKKMPPVEEERKEDSIFDQDDIDFVRENMNSNRSSSLKLVLGSLEQMYADISERDKDELVPNFTLSGRALQKDKVKASVLKTRLRGEIATFKLNPLLM